MATTGRNPRQSSIPPLLWEQLFGGTFVGGFLPNMARFGRSRRVARGNSPYEATTRNERVPHSKSGIQFYCIEGSNPSLSASVTTT